MGRRREDKALPEDVSSLVHRIRWLLTDVFSDNIAWMAKALGASHAALSRVLAGQMPSGKMLEALVQRADVNPWWLLGGEMQAGHGQRTGGLLCPIADALLPGEPRAYPEKLSVVTLPVASPFLAEQAYWYRVQPDDLIANDRKSRVVAGDYLLIEASERWTRRSEAFVGRLVALRMSEGGKVVLGKVAPHKQEFEEEPQHEVRTFGSTGEAVLYLRPRGTTAAKPVRRFIERPGLVSFYLDDIAGVCLQLARVLERDR